MGGSAADLKARAGETLDSIGGRIQILQREDGYRFNLDAVLLAAFGIGGFVEGRSVRAIDLGAGAGVVALLLKAWCPEWAVTAVELQPTLADLARRNAVLNALPISVVEADWRTLGVPGRAGEADLIVCNPPYFAADRGQPCADPEKAAARQELNGDLSEAVQSAARLVKGNGSVRFIQAAPRLTELLAAFAEAGLGVARLQFVHAKRTEPAYAVLAEGLPGSKRALVVEPPVIVQNPDGGYTTEVAAWLGA